MVIGAVGLVVVLASTELFESVGLIEVFVAGVVPIIAEAIVVIGAITINNLLAATTATAAINHPSEHNIY